MSDWKPGDRFTLEFEVARVDSDGVRSTDSQFIRPHVMARAVKLPPKARPVRKGGLITCPDMADEDTEFVYVGSIDDAIFCRTERRGSFGAYMGNFKHWTHADGTPISWEASE